MSNIYWNSLHFAFFEFLAIYVLDISSDTMQTSNAMSLLLSGASLIYPWPNSLNTPLLSFKQPVPAMTNPFSSHKSPQILSDSGVVETRTRPNQMQN